MSLKLSPLVALLRRAELSVVRGLFRLPPRVQTWLSMKPTIVVDGLTLDPQIQLLLAARKLRGSASIHVGGPEESRAAMVREALWYSDGGAPVARVTDRTIPGADGPIPARFYETEGGDGETPLLVFFHGGGYVTGDLDTHDDPCRALCHHAKCNVLAVDYRLAPEHPFPAGVDDALAAFRWAASHAKELGADPARIGVAGDSAGGNFAAVVSQECARSGGPSPALQVLIYPTTDRSTKHPSASLFAEGFFLTASDIDWFDGHYLPSPSLRKDPRVSPLLTPDLSGVCPAIVVTAGFDPLRDEGDAYAAALKRANVPTRYLRFDGLVHAFINMGNVSGVAQAALVQIAEEVGRAFAERSGARDV